jgi:signal peptidase II
MRLAKRFVVLLVVLFATVGCDQATKSLAQRHLMDAPTRSFLNGTVSLHYAENPGAFLSLGAALPAHLQSIIFTLLVAVILGALFIYSVRELSRAHTTIVVALALFLGGGIGNLIDRVTNDGRVIDFMHIGVGFVQTGIFNVADMALMAAVALLALHSYRTWRLQT